MSGFADRAHRTAKMASGFVEMKELPEKGWYYAVQVEEGFDRSLEFTAGVITANVNRCDPKFWDCPEGERWMMTIRCIGIVMFELDAHDELSARREVVTFLSDLGTSIAWHAVQGRP